MKFYSVNFVHYNGNSLPYLFSVPVINPIDANGDDDDLSISIIPDMTCELCKDDNMRSDKVNSIGSSSKII